MPADHRTGYEPKTTLDVVVVGEALVDIVISPDGTTEHPGDHRQTLPTGSGGSACPRLC